MEGETPPAHCKVTRALVPAAQMRARLFLSTAACKDVNFERGAAASEHVAQYVGCSSKADLRVSGPRSTSSCSFALVMWLYHTDPPPAVQCSHWSSKLQRWEQKEPPRVGKELSLLC